MPPPPPPKTMPPRAPSPPALEMQESREIYHQYLRQTKPNPNPRPETHSSCAAKRTAQPSATLPPLREAALEREDAMNWKDFLSHSHIDHDATRCATCLAAKIAGREGDVQGPKVEGLQAARREGEVLGPKVGDLPPVLPPLRPLSPMMGGVDMWKWEGEGRG